MSNPSPVADAMLPHEAEVVERIVEAPDIITLRLRFTDPALHAAYRFEPGQFNMLYLYGVGEVPISIVSDPEDEHLYDHTIRAVGRVTRALVELQPGQRLGVRGPYGRGWPMAQARGGDVLVATGGLGCAPVVSVVNHVLAHRADYGRLIIMQGVRHHNDLIWRERYEALARQPDTEVLLAASQGDALWPWHVGHVPELFDQARLDAGRTTAMMCGPEGMIRAACEGLLRRGFAEESLWLSMERNMQCAAGHCGHCQFGGLFVCKDGPVFNYPEVKALFGVRGA